MEPRRWRSWAVLAEVFEGPPDPDRDADRALLDEDVRDSWAHR